VFFVKGDIVFGNAERNRFHPVTPKSKIRDGDTTHTSSRARNGYHGVARISKEMVGAATIAVIMTAQQTLAAMMTPRR